MASLDSGVRNGVYITNKIMQAFGLKDYQAVGFAGCWMCESHCNPGAYNKAEKAGTFKGSSANGAGYGAGLALWSNSWKSSIQKQFNRYTSIETWTMDLLIAIVTQGCSTSFILLLRNCSSAGLSTDIVLRGYENGSCGKGTSLRSQNSMKAYTWCKKSYIADSGYQTFSDGYVGALTARTSWANKILKAMGSTSISDLADLGGMSFADGGTDGTYGGTVGGTNNSYPVHDEYTTYTGSGGNIFSSASANSFTLASMTSTIDSSATTTKHTRIYSTNDSCIVLDELSLPADVSDGNSWANKGVTNEDVSTRLSQLNATTTNSSMNTANSSTAVKTK